MTISRREFLKTTSIALGAAALPTWVYSADLSGVPLPDVDKNGMADTALKLAKNLGAEYCDIRVNKYRIESLAAREREIRRVASGQNAGFGVRVLYKGTWGFAASPLMNTKEVERVTREAFEIAKANSAFQTKPVRLTKEKAVTGSWKSGFKIDPFDVSADEKIKFLMDLNEAALSVKGVSFVNSSMAWVNEQKFLATSDGTRVEQYLIRGVPDFSVTAVDRTKGDFASRNALAQGRGAGWEYTKDYDWLGEAKTAGEEAVMKLTAKPVEPGKYDLILHPSHLFLTIHESVGHSTELDRALLLGSQLCRDEFSYTRQDRQTKIRLRSRKFCGRPQPNRRTRDGRLG